MAGLLGVAAYLVLVAAVVLAFVHVVISWPGSLAHKASAVAIVLFVECAALAVAR